VLACLDAAGAERAAVADALDVVDDRDRGVARAQEVRVQGVDHAVRLDGAARRSQGLRGYLPAEDALERRLGWLQPAVEVHLDLLEVEDGDEFSD
jgi:hypothetical protein